MVKKKENSFEESLKKLETSANLLKSDDISLEEAIKAFEDGLEYYNRCSEILESAKQKIEVYNK